MNNHPADASENTGSPEKPAANPAPYYADSNRTEADRDWVIPTILVLVTIVVISSTFFDEELAKLRTATNLSYSDNETKRMADSEAHRSLALTETSAEIVRPEPDNPAVALVATDGDFHSAPKTTTPTESGQFPATDSSLRTNTPQLAQSSSKHDRLESRESMYRHRVALRAAARERMRQDRRDMLRRTLEIQRDVLRARAASLMRRNRTLPYSSTGYLM